MKVERTTVGSIGRGTGDICEVWWSAHRGREAGASTATTAHTEERAAATPQQGRGGR